jgi:hypothetical protein
VFHGDHITGHVSAHESGRGDVEYKRLRVIGVGSVYWGTTLPLGEDRGMEFAVDEMTALRSVALAVVISDEGAGRWLRLRDSETKHDDEATGVRDRVHRPGTAWHGLGQALQRRDVSQVEWRE